jgi:AP endonuclease-1
LILETPSFEQPAEVWGKEIEVLMKLSGSSGNLGDGSPSKKLEEDGSASDKDASRRALEAMIRVSVKLAESENGGGKSKKMVEGQGGGQEEEERC